MINTAIMTQMLNKTTSRSAEFLNLSRHMTDLHFTDANGASECRKMADSSSGAGEGSQEGRSSGFPQGAHYVAKERGGRESHVRRAVADAFAVGGDQAVRA